MVIQRLYSGARFFRCLTFAMSPSDDVVHSRPRRLTASAGREKDLRVAIPHAACSTEPAPAQCLTHILFSVGHDETPEFLTPVSSSRCGGGTRSALPWSAEVSESLPHSYGVRVGQFQQRAPRLSSTLSPPREAGGSLLSGTLRGLGGQRVNGCIRGREGRGWWAWKRREEAEPSARHSPA